MIAPPGATYGGIGIFVRGTFSIEPIFTHGLNVSAGRCQDQHSDRFGHKRLPGAVSESVGTRADTP